MRYCDRSTPLRPAVVLSHDSCGSPTNGHTTNDCGPILVADDDSDFRALVSAILAVAGFETLEASNSADALHLARTESPSVVLLDVNFGGASGYAVCSELRHEFGDDLPIVFVSGERTEAFDRVGGLVVGADDYIVKPFHPEEFVLRVRRLAERRHASSFEDRVGRETSTSTSPFGLTPREDEVLGLLVAGLSQTEIGDRLVISPNTVATHIQRVLQKMDVRSRAQAVAFALRSHALPTAT